MIPHQCPGTRIAIAWIVVRLSYRSTLLTIISTLTILPFIAGCRTSNAGHLAEMYPPELYAEWNMKVYTATLEYIRTDTMARRIFNHPDTFQVRVCDKITCLTDSYFWDWRGWLQWMGLPHRERKARRRVEDSLYRHTVRTRCVAARNPALERLSTADDWRYAVEFMQIDSTFLPGNYIASAYLWDNVDRLDVSSRYVEAGMMYTIVFGKDNQIRKVFTRSAH